MDLNPQSSAARVDPSVIEKYLDALFGDYEWEDGEGLALRGLNEKNVAGGKHFAENAWASISDGRDEVSPHATRWCAHGHGAFIVPAVVRVGDSSRDGARDADVVAYTCLCLDLDNADTAEHTKFSIEGAIGPASMVVESSPGKLHLYWLFNEPETDVRKVARMRHILALKVGGDTAFQRLPQVIRIPGSIHGKGGVKSEVQLLHCDPDCRHSFAFLAERIDEMFPLPHRAAGADKELARLSGAVGGGLMFTPQSSVAPSTAEEAEVAGGLLTRDILPGGASGIVRHDALNAVTGHYIHAARVGEMTLEEAKEACRGWNLSQSSPSAPEKFESTWTALVARDVDAHGPIGGAASVYNRQGLQPINAEVDSAPVQPGAPGPRILDYAVNRWVDPNNVPKRKWLVQGLIRAGAAHVLAAEGGVGKTFALLDLALKVGSPRMGDTWLGQPLNRTHTGGYAVILTTEDDYEECWIRLAALDPGGARMFAARDRIIVVPLLQAGGVFPLVEMRNGVACPSPAWDSMLNNELARLHTKESPVQFAAIDTLAATLHGEENSSVVVQQYVSALNMVQKVAPGCATMVTHHIRKQGTEAVPIQSAADMRNAIRGSNALLGGVRMALGIWQDSEWREELPKMGLPAKSGTLFRLAVVKGNNNEVMEGERQLVRAPDGGLQGAPRERVDPETAERRAWILAAVGRAVAEGRPYTTTKDNGIAVGQRHTLPPALSGGDGEPPVGEKALIKLVDAMVDQERTLVRCAITRAGKAAYLDLPDGDMHRSEATGWKPRSGGYKPDWSGWVYDPATMTCLKT